MIIQLLFQSQGLSYIRKRFLSIILIISALSLLVTSCVPSHTTNSTNIEDIPIRNLLGFIDLDELLEHYGFSVEHFFSTPERIEELTTIVKTLHDKALAEEIPFPHYIFSTRSGDYLRLNTDLLDTIEFTYFISFRDASKEEIIATVNMFGLQMSDLTSMYAYDGETSLDDLQVFAKKAVDKIISGQLPIYSKIQRGKYWNSLHPSEVEILQALDINVDVN